MTRGVLPCWLLLCAVSLGHTRPRSSSLTPELPECLAQSVCGYVQLNVAGVNSEQLCRCPDDVRCPLVWDPLDGRTVSHGNDQYKYCERSPRLSVCSTEEVVYSSYVEMSFATSGKLVNTAHVHCLCPPTHIFAQNQTKFHQYNNGVTSMAVSSLCKPPPICEPVEADACMAISESFLTGTTFLKRDCACPIGRYCPSDLRRAADRVELPKGVYYLMNCI